MKNICFLWNSNYRTICLQEKIQNIPTKERIVYEWMENSGQRNV